MKLSFAFALLSLVLGLVYAAPTTYDAPVNTNCFSLTYPVNGTVWNTHGTYNISWNIYEECKGTYYPFMIPTVIDENGEYAMGMPNFDQTPIDMKAGNITIILDKETAGTYVVTIAKSTGEDIDDTDYAVITV
ncbi:hypothetical protein CLU79DRAFT_761710, partial [Phycomyces nitens]